MVRTIAGVLLLAHGLVHLLYLAPDDDAFSLESGPVPEAKRRPVAAVLMSGSRVSVTGCVPLGCSATGPR